MKKEVPGLKVRVEYNGVVADFSGKDADEVLHAIYGFLAGIIPELELAKKLHLRYTLRDLAEMFGDYIKVTPEGPRVMPPDVKLSDKQIIALHLIAVRVAYELGKTDSDRVTLQEIEKATALNPKSISSRLSELVKMNYVERVSENRTTLYRITTQGINWLAKVLNRKLLRA